MVLCCNPPLIPGETGWAAVADHGGWEAPFWYRLISHCAEAGARELFLHVFELHGIWQRTGKWPSIAEIADASRYSMECVYRGVRDVSSTSQVRIHLLELADLFPLGLILTGGVARELRSIGTRRDLQYIPMELPHAVLRLRSKRQE